MYLQNHTTEMDERTFRRFIESYSSDLLYYVRCFTRSKEEAEEIVSDVFFEVWQHKHNIDEIQNIKAWLLTITHNKTISHLRKKDISNISLTWDEVGDHVISHELQTPDEELISREEMSRINHIINNLPPRCKQVFVLAKIEKLPYKDIADLLSISVKTINAHVAKALELISESLKK